MSYRKSVFSSATENDQTVEDLPADPLGISQLQNDFEALILKITERVNSLSQQAMKSAQLEQSSIESLQIKRADEEIKRLKALISQCEEFDLDFQKIGQIGEFAKEFKKRILDLEKQL